MLGSLSTHIGVGLIHEDPLRRLRTLDIGARVASVKPLRRFDVHLAASRSRLYR
jgi:hypothetical protein